MKIGLLSDTHSYIDDRILHFLSDCDEVWHAGDIGTFAVCEAIEKMKPLKAVHGNIDTHEIRHQYPEDQIFICEGKKVWITHIGGAPPKYNPQIRKKLLEIRPDIFVCGHSHILRVASDPAYKMLFLNPGAAGKHGFHKVRTLLKFEINAGKVENMQAVELGTRA